MSSTMNSATAPESQNPSVYVPMHKRDTSRGLVKVPPVLSLGGAAPGEAALSSPVSSVSSMLSVSPRSPTFGKIAIAEEDNWRSRTSTSQSTRLLPVYTIVELIALSKSPLVSIPREKREEIRRNVPDIYMNRKQRQARVMREANSNVNVTVNENGNRHASATAMSNGMKIPNSNSQVPSAFLQYPQKLKRQSQWQEKRERVAHQGRDGVENQTPIQTQHVTEALPSKPLLHGNAKSAPPTQTSFAVLLKPLAQVQNQEPKTPPSFPPRRTRRAVERRRGPKVIVDELNWRTGVRQRAWSAQGVVLPPQ